MKPNHINGALWLTGVLAGINFAILNALHLFWFEPMNAGEKLFDSRLTGYDTAKASQIVANLGDDGRAAHVFWHNQIFDFSFPLLFSAFAILLLLKLGQRMPRFARIGFPWRIGFIAGIVLPYTYADLEENSAVQRILEHGLPVDQATVVLASALTVVKWASVALLFAVVALFFLSGRRTQAGAHK